MSRLVPRWALVGILIVAATGGCKQGPWSLWNAYAEQFIDDQGRVIDQNAANHSTSEGQAYAMFFALADNDRAQFDRLLAWTENNLAGGSLATRLPGWLWGKAPSGEWKLLDANPASDADCWMAYALLEAGRLWNDDSYGKLGRQMMSMIAKQEVTEIPGFGTMLMPGTTALFVHDQKWTVNPSYLPLFLFQRFDEVDPSGPWGAITLNIPLMLRQSARQGFAMDWVDYEPGVGFSPAPGPVPATATVAGKPAAGTKIAPGKPAVPPQPVAPAKAGVSPKTAGAKQAAAAQLAPGQKPAMGSYDAIRVYLWAGMTNVANGERAEFMAAVPAMANYVAKRIAPPEEVDADGDPQAKPGPIGFSAALLPWLWPVPDFAQAAAQLKIKMSQQLNPASGLYGKDPAYYDQNLILFATGFLDGRFRFAPHGELRVEWTR